MQKVVPVTKYYIFSYIIIFIPFLEFFYSNIKNIDIQIFNQLVIYFIIIFSFFSFFNFIVLKLCKEKPYVYILSFSFIFWLLFRFKSIRDFLSVNYFELNAEISFVLVILLSILFFFLINKKNIYKRYYFFLFLFFILQNIILIVFISLSYFKFIEPNIFKNDTYKKYIKHINKSKNYFSDDEIQFIKKNSNKNIYYFIFDGMTSLSMYQDFASKKKIEIDNIKKKFLDKNFIYVEDTYSSYNSTKTTFGSMLQMQPIFVDNLNTNSQIYNDQLYPRSLSKYNFDNNRHPNLIYNINKLNYKFLWLGNAVGCEIYNPEICIDYVPESKIINFKVNRYILESFLENTPLMQIYYLFTKMFFKETFLKNSYNADFTDKFFNNHHIDHYNKNYFYLIHNLLPIGGYSFESNCDLKEKVRNFDYILEKYIKNYDCALKKINEIINFLEKKDPEAVVIFQGDNGVVYVDKKLKNLPTHIDRYKIFNMVKVPKKCQKLINNNLDNINSVRLAISCATNTKPKLLKSIRLKAL